MTDKPHYRHEEYEIFDHFIGCCPQITTFEFNAGGHPYGGKKSCLLMHFSFPQTDEPYYFPVLEFKNCWILKGSNPVT